MASSDSSPSPGATALVTGASGFIGRHLVDRLERAGVTTHATTRSDPGPSLPASAAWHRLDLADADAVRAKVAEIRPNQIYHLASHVAGSRDLALVTPTFEGNFLSTLHLLNAAADVGVDRFVQVGSLEEPTGDDGAPPIPSSPYAAAKAAASLYSRMFHLLYDVPVVIARVFMVYGPGVQDEKKLVPYVLRSLLGGEAPSFGSGTRPVDWVFAPDVADGLYRLGTAPGLAGERVDLGTGQLVTVRGMVETLFREMAPELSPAFGGRVDRQAEQVRAADVDRTAELLGWRPSTTVKDGVAQTVDWFRRHPAP